MGHYGNTWCVFYQLDADDDDALVAVDDFLLILDNTCELQWTERSWALLHSHMWFTGLTLNRHFFFFYLFHTFCPLLDFTPFVSLAFDLSGDWNGFGASWNCCVLEEVALQKTNVLRCAFKTSIPLRGTRSICQKTKAPWQWKYTWSSLDFLCFNRMFVFIQNTGRQNSGIWTDWNSMNFKNIYANAFALEGL